MGQGLEFASGRASLSLSLFFKTILLFPPGLNPLRFSRSRLALFWLVFAGTRRAQQRAQSLGLKVRGETFGPIRVAGNSREDWHPSPPPLMPGVNSTLWQPATSKAREHPFGLAWPVVCRQGPDPLIHPVVPCPAAPDPCLRTFSPRIPAALFSFIHPESISLLSLASALTSVRLVRFSDSRC